MVVRRRKKRNKLLGSRTRGKGDTKNRRGAGSRGGRGLAGSHKHKYAKYHTKFGKEKRKLMAKKQVKAINLDQLMQIMPRLLAAGKVSSEGEKLIIDGTKTGLDKLLSKGSLEQKLIVRNIKASKKAAEKIKKAGGQLEEPVEETEGKKKAEPGQKTKSEKGNEEKKIEEKKK
jgi:large subunit ribosomal protein L15